MRHVTFVTNCWEKDWDILLKTDFLKNKIVRNRYDFAEKMLVINNVNDRPKVEKEAQKAVDKGVITIMFLLRTRSMMLWQVLKSQKNH